MSFQLDDVIECVQAIKYLKRKEKICKLFILKLEAAKEISRVLNVVRKITIALQESDCTLSDFFAYWQILEMKLNKYKHETNRTKLAEKLLSNMQRRKSALFDNPAMVVAVFLDPRYRHHIENNPAKMKLAKDTLCYLWQRLKIVKQGNASSNSVLNDSNSSNTSKSSTEMDQMFSELDQHYAQQGIAVQQKETQCDADKTRIYAILDSFNPVANGNRLQSKESIIAFWEDHKDEYKGIYPLACVIYGINPSEVPIERDFSALRHIFNERRARLSIDLLQDILLIHMNKDLFYLVCEECLEQAKLDG